MARTHKNKRGLKPSHKYTTKSGKVRVKETHSNVYDKYTKDDTARIVTIKEANITYTVEVLLPGDPLLTTQVMGYNIDDLITVEPHVVGLIIDIEDDTNDIGY